MTSQEFFFNFFIPMLKIYDNCYEENINNNNMFKNMFFAKAADVSS